jgi:hypothetical protein
MASANDHQHHPPPPKDDPKTKPAPAPAPEKYVPVSSAITVEPITNPSKPDSDTSQRALAPMAIRPPRQKGPFSPHEKPQFSGPVAFIMELDPSAVPNIITVMLHFATVLGPDWPIVLVTLERNWRMPKSRPFHRLMREGQFRVLYLPPQTAITDHHSVSVFLTSPWLWEQFETADRVLIFQPDGILCSSSPQSVEDFLEWDMIGAPISFPHGAGYNGGLTMRNPKLMLEIARDPNLKLGPEDAEDQWFYERAKERGAHLPSYDVAKKFSVESIYYDEPMGYHQPSRWQINNIDKILKWCPEVGMLQNGRFA